MNANQLFEECNKLTAATLEDFNLSAYDASCDEFYPVTFVKVGLHELAIVSQSALTLQEVWEWLGGLHLEVGKKQVHVGIGETEERTFYALTFVAVMGDGKLDQEGDGIIDAGGPIFKIDPIEFGLSATIHYTQRVKVLNPAFSPEKIVEMLQNNQAVHSPSKTINLSVEGNLIPIAEIVVSQNSLNNAFALR